MAEGDLGKRMHWRTELIFLFFFLRGTKQGSDLKHIFLKFLKCSLKLRLASCVSTVRQLHHCSKWTIHYSGSTGFYRTDNPVQACIQGSMPLFSSCFFSQEDKGKRKQLNWKRPLMAMTSVSKINLTNQNTAHTNAIKRLVEASQ